MTVLKELVFAVTALTAVFAVGTARSENVLFVLADGVPASLDVDGQAGTHTPSQEGMINLLEPLLDYGIGGSSTDGGRMLDYSKFVPALAESWSFNAEANTWTLKLRHNVKSCTGNPFSADDVVYTFARAKSLSGQVPVGYFLASVASLKKFIPALFGSNQTAPDARKLGDEVLKVDDYTVQFKLSAPNQLFLPVMSIFGLRIYDSVDMKLHASEADPWSHVYANSRNAPSFGSYCLEKWTKDVEFVARVNPNYYGDKPYFDRVTVRKVPQSSNRVAILRAGRAQVASGLDPREIDWLKTAPSVKIVGGYLNSSLIVIANFKIEPFNNIKLRQALAYAIPYPDIIRSSYYGMAKQWNGFIPSAYPGYHTPKMTYTYDPTKAKALLAEAGYPDGKGLEAFSGAFRLAYPSERESILGPPAILIQTRLRALGIPVELDPLPATQFADRQLVKKDLPFGLSDQSKAIGVDPIYWMRLGYMSVPLGVSNQTNFSDTKFDELSDEVLIETDPVKRQAELDTMQDLLAEKLAVLPVVETKLLYAIDATISGLVVHPSQALVWKYLYR